MWRIKGTGTVVRVCVCGSIPTYYIGESGIEIASEACDSVDSSLYRQIWKRRNSIRGETLGKI